MKFRKIILVIALIAIIGIGIALAVVNKKSIGEKNNNKIQVVASNFASYDFLKQIIGDSDNINLTFLLGPGKDAHSYDPTAQDIITIQNADLFVYVGGGMEKWAPKVLESLDTSKEKVICISNDVQKKDEVEIDGAEPEEDDDDADVVGGAFDEHIWTSPANAISMVNALENAMEELDSSNISKYKLNANNYINEIKDVDSQIQTVVNNKKRDRLVFGDKMPMQYFMDYYKLNVSAAFSGCSTETEPSSKTIAYLVDTVKKDNIPAVLYIELGVGKVANTIAAEAGNGCKALQIQTLHNVSKEDFDNGETWVSLMKRNIDVLKVALD